MLHLRRRSLSPIVFLRLYKQVRKRALPITTIAPFTSRGSEKLGAKVIKSAAGDEASAIASITGLTSRSVILVGERLSESIGGFSAAVSLAESSGAKLAWIPRRAGERGALEAGAIGNLLPAGRPVSDAKARVDIQTAWGVNSLPTQEGRDSEGILQALHNGEIDSLLIGGVDPLDISAHLHDGLKKAFVVSLEIRKSAVTEIANVVLPVAAVVEKSGTFINWEGRARNFDVAIQDSLTRSDVRVLSMLADQMGTPINLPTVEAAATEFKSLGGWEERVKFNPTPAHRVAHSSSDALLASWRLLIDTGSLQDGEANLAGTAHPSVVVISKARAEKLGVKSGDRVRISNKHGEVVLPCEIGDIEENSVWIPRNSVESRAIESLGTVNGPVSVVRA